MDYNKIGTLITSERKKLKLTQAKLAEKLFVSEKTISKWETGNGIPDTNTLPKLCEIFKISINEILNGERINSESYVDKAENKLLELQTEKEKTTKLLLRLEIAIGILGTLFLFASVYMFSYFIENKTWLGIIILILGFAIFLFAVIIALKIEQVAGYYVCKKCSHKYIPTFTQVNLAMHIGRTRYMKCPHCKKYSWNKKVIK